MLLQLDSQLQTPLSRLSALRRCSADRRRNKHGSDVPVLGGEDGHVNDHPTQAGSRTIRRTGTAAPAACQRVKLWMVAHVSCFSTLHKHTTTCMYIHESEHQS